MVIITLFMGAYLVSPFFTTIISLEQNILLFILLIMASLEIIETRLYDIEEQVGKSSSVFKDYFYALDELNDIIDNGEHETAHILVYSCGWNRVQDTIEHLIRKEVKIRLLVKDPVSTVNENEQALTISALTWLWDFHERYDNLEIRFYEAQGSVMAFKLNDHLQIGWYTYDQQGDRIVWGHKNAAIQFSSEDTEEHQIIDRWFCNHFYALWKGGITPKKFYEREKDKIEGERKAKKFLEWIETEAPDIGDRRKEWLDQISKGEYTDKEEMFPNY